MIFLNIFECLKENTTVYVIYGGHGRYPLGLLIKKKHIGFMYKLLNKDYNLSSTVYRIVVQDSFVSNNVYSWFNCVKDILNECGHVYIWYNQSYHFSREHHLF